MATDSKELIDCSFRPTLTGPTIQVKISLIDYEIMCKQTVDEDFCECEMDAITSKVVNETSKELTIDEFLVTKTVIKEVYVERDGKLNLENESN